MWHWEDVSKSSVILYLHSLVIFSLLMDLAVSSASWSWVASFFYAVHSGTVSKSLCVFLILSLFLCQSVTQNQLGAVFDYTVHFLSLSSGFLFTTFHFYFSAKNKKEILSQTSKLHFSQNHIFHVTYCVLSSLSFLFSFLSVPLSSLISLAVPSARPSRNV